MFRFQQSAKLDSLAEDFEAFKRKLDYLSFDPSRPDWVFRVYSFDDRKLKGPNTIYTEQGSGWLWYLWIKSSDPALKWAVTFKAKVDFTTETDFNTENDNGGQNSLTGYRIIKFDAANSIYVMEYGPGFHGLGVPFRGLNQLDLKNPQNTDITVSLQAILILRVDQPISQQEENAKG